MAVNSSSHLPTLRRRNILTLDGGGVRGLSPLLILQDLMRHVNLEIRHRGHGQGAQRDVEPREIFEFFAGTSTGGLIAIMLGKLEMTLEECIQAYYEFSERIFGKKHIRGRLTHGLAPARYSGKTLENQIKRLLERKNLPVQMAMSSDSDRDKIACAVICREHTDRSKYSELREGPVLLSTIPCEHQVKCRVTEAARATSAAMTYFPIQEINSRYFSDGGLEYNNPSKAVFDYYARFDQISQARGNRGQPNRASFDACHGCFDMSIVRFINLGTGTKPESLPRRERDRLANFVPGVIRFGMFLKKTLTEIAVEAEQVASHMTTIAQVSNAGSSCDLKFYRFSANNGVCFIKLDEYKELNRIRDLTMRYIGSDETQKNLKKLGEEIAIEYLESQNEAFASSLSVPEITAITV